ncbi:MAG: hypothetical protein ACXAC6_07655 [Candidatus Hodarchaeales archaeon]
MKIKKKLVSLTFLTALLLLSGGVFLASAGNGNEAGALDRDRIQDQSYDGDCDRDCICDGPGDCECKAYGPSDGEGGSQFGQDGDNDPKLRMVQHRIRWQYQWQWIEKYT